MMKKIWVLGAIAGAAAVFACSSSSGGGGASACLQSSTSSACYSCTQQNCGSELSNAESACSDYLNCVCAGGSFNACNEQSCSSKITSGCASALQNSSCSACTSQCSSGGQTCSSSSSGGGSGGGSGGSSGSSSGGGTGFCQSTSVCISGLSSSTCSTEGGTLVASCSTTNLVGCCKFSGSSLEECYYAGTASSLQSACTQSNGTWSTSP